LAAQEFESAMVDWLDIPSSPLVVLFSAKAAEHSYSGRFATGGKPLFIFIPMFIAAVVAMIVSRIIYRRTIRS